MITIDTREGKLIELIKASPEFKPTYEIKNLLIGDIIITPSNNISKTLIIERKCITDLIASIKDGRYKEQKLRLQSEMAKSNETIICYLIEGSTQTDFRYPADKVMFNGAIVSSIFRDKIPVIRTSNLKETMDMISRLYDRMFKDINDFFPKNKIYSIKSKEGEGDGEEINEIENEIENKNEEIQISSGTYLESIKKCKKENLNPKIWNQIALSSIPGVSTNIAQKITDVFPTIKKLMEEYNKYDNDELRIKLISEIVLTDNGKVKRRIGNVVAKRIMEYLYIEN